MKRIYIQCEACGKVVADPYDEAGWISINKDANGAQIQRSEGRDERGTAITTTLSGAVDFCSIDCLEKKLDSIDTARKPRIKSQ